MGKERLSVPNGTHHFQVREYVFKYKLAIWMSHQIVISDMIPVDELTLLGLAFPEKWKVVGAKLCF
jgi:hypothetical protein